LAIPALAAALAVAAVGALMPAIAQGQDAKRGEVVVAIPGWAFALNPQIAVVAEQYNDEHPDQPRIKLTLNPVAQETLDTSRYLLEAAEKRSSFDAWFGFTPFIDMIKLVEGDVVQPWDDCIADSTRADINPAYLQEATFADGNLYSWPQVASAVLLAYRPSMLAAAGYSEPPSTWQELLEVATAIEESLPGVKGLAMDLRTWRTLIPFSVNQAGGSSVFGEDGYLNLDDPNTLAAVELMVELAKHAPPDILTPTGDMDTFKSGLTAMLIKYVDAAGTAARAFGENDIAITTLPTPTDDASEIISVGWGTGFALFKYGDYPDIACEFVEFLTNSELYQRAWLGANQSTVYQSWQDALADSAPAWMDGQTEALATSTFIPPSADFIQWHSIVKPWMEREVLGEVSAAEALEGAKAEVEQILGS
jgi:multiple sugar transport system substrate-binding protein